MPSQKMQRHTCCFYVHGTGPYVGYSILHMDEYQLLTYLGGTPVCYNTLPHDFVAARITTNHVYKKIQINHGDKLAANKIHNISANIAPFLILDECCYPYSCVLMKICSDLHGNTQLLSSPYQEIIDSVVQHLQFQSSGKKRRTILDCANSGLSLLPPLLKMGGIGSICRSKR